MTEGELMSLITFYVGCSLTVGYHRYQMLRQSHLSGCRVTRGMLIINAFLSIIPILNTALVLVPLLERASHWAVRKLNEPIFK